MQDDWAEKTEVATPHKRAEARRQGNIPRSEELAAAVVCLALLLLLRQTGGQIVAGMKGLMSESFSGAGPSLTHIAGLLGTAIIPLLLGLALISLLSGLIQTGFFFGFRKSTGALNPGRGLENILSGRSAAQVALNLLKLAIVSVVVWVTVRGRVNELLMLLTRPTPALLGAAGSLAFVIGIHIVAALLALGLIDYAYQRYRHERDLRMTRREVKDELKRQEGDLTIKRHRRAVRRSLAAGRRA